MSVKMIAWAESQKHCGLGPVYQENEDPKSVELLFNMVHKSVMPIRYDFFEISLTLDGVKHVPHKHFVMSK